MKNDRTHFAISLQVRAMALGRRTIRRSHSQQCSLAQRQISPGYNNSSPPTNKPPPAAPTLSPHLTRRPPGALHALIPSSSCLLIVAVVGRCCLGEKETRPGNLRTSAAPSSQHILHKLKEIGFVVGLHTAEKLGHTKLG